MFVYYVSAYILFRRCVVLGIGIGFEFVFLQISIYYLISNE